MGISARKGAYTKTLARVPNPREQRSKQHLAATAEPRHTPTHTKALLKKWTQCRFLRGWWRIASRRRLTLTSNALRTHTLTACKETCALMCQHDAACDMERMPCSQPAAAGNRMVTMVTDGHQGRWSGHRLIDIAHRHSVGTNHSRHQNMCRRTMVYLCVAEDQR